MEMATKNVKQIYKNLYLNLQIKKKKGRERKKQ